MSAEWLLLCWASDKLIFSQIKLRALAGREEESCRAEPRMFGRIVGQRIALHLQKHLRHPPSLPPSVPRPSPLFPVVPAAKAESLHNLVLALSPAEVRPRLIMEMGPPFTQLTFRATHCLPRRQPGASLPPVQPLWSLSTFDLLGSLAFIPSAPIRPRSLARSLVCNFVRPRE